MYISRYYESYIQHKIIKYSNIKEFFLISFIIIYLSGLVLTCLLSLKCKMETYPKPACVYIRQIAVC